MLFTFLRDLLGKSASSLPEVAISTSRNQDNGDGWTEIFLNPIEASAAASAGEALECGHSVVLLHGLASFEECKAIRLEASSAADRHRSGDSASQASLASGGSAEGRVRMPVVNMVQQRRSHSPAMPGTPPYMLHRLTSPFRVFASSRSEARDFATPSSTVRSIGSARPAACERC